jgi:hypothetical protein
MSKNCLIYTGSMTPLQCITGSMMHEAVFISVLFISFAVFLLFLCLYYSFSFVVVFHLSPLFLFLDLWEADSHSASQEIPCLLRHPKVHYRVHNSTPLASIVSQITPVQTFPPCFRKIHSNIIFPSTSTSSEWSLPFNFFFLLCSVACYFLPCSK